MIDSSLSKRVFIEKVDKEEAYALLARAYIALDYPDKAEKTVRELIKLNNEYIPVAPMDPEFQKLVNRLKEEQQIKKKRKKMKYWIMGGTGAVVAVVSYIILT